jgi:CRP-like cAMP-binding protein
VLLRADTRVELLRGLPLFEFCSKRDLRRIAALAVEREVEAGTELIREGEPAGEFYVVVEGEVDVRRRGRRVAKLSAGSYVGEIALLSLPPHRDSGIAATPPVTLGPHFVGLLTRAARALARWRERVQRRSTDNA